MSPYNQESRAIIGPRVGTIVHTRTSGRRLHADSLPHVRWCVYRDMIYDHFINPRASLGPRMLAHAAPISSFTCFAGGESPPLKYHWASDI